MAPISKLPPEVLILIFQAFHGRGENDYESAFFCCAATCREWNKIAFETYFNNYMKLNPNPYHGADGRRSMLAGSWPIKVLFGAGIASQKFSGDRQMFKLLKINAKH